jgi:hypothetical protein
MPEWIAAPARTARNKEARGWWRKWGALPIWNFDARAQFFLARAQTPVLMRTGCELQKASNSAVFAAIVTFLKNRVDSPARADLYTVHRRRGCFDSLSRSSFRAS